MSTRVVRRLLDAATSILLCFGIAFGLFLVLSPIDDSTPAVADAPAQRSQPTRQHVPTHVVNGIVPFQPVWGKRLQGPLTDPPKQVVDTKPVDTPKATPALAVVTFEGELIGTLVDPDEKLGRALLLYKGKKRLVSAGEELADMPGQPKIVKIFHRGLQIELNQQVVRVEMKAPGLAKVDSTANPFKLESL